MKAKAYTDIQQGRKLAEILPIESADMSYFYRHWEIDINYAIGDKENLSFSFNKERYEKYKDGSEGWYIPCWCLAALFEIIPTVIERANNRCRLRMDKSEEDFDIWYEDIDSCIARLDLDIITPNMVDACVEMIIKLHNEKLIP